METFYLFLVIFLFVLAIVDLSVGVSNDAVNFLNSAIGARTPAFLFLGDHVYPCGRYAYGCGATGYF